VVICLERCADLHMAQLMPLPLTVSCFCKIQIGFTFLVPAHPSDPGQRAVKRTCVRACVRVYFNDYLFQCNSTDFFEYSISRSIKRLFCRLCKWTASFTRFRVCMKDNKHLYSAVLFFSLSSMFYFVYQAVVHISKYMRDFTFCAVKRVCLHCFDTVGWASGRASGL